MAANWINVRYVGTTPISVNFKTWYPNEIHAMPEGQLEEFKRIHGDVLVVLGPNKGDVPGEGPADQTWPYGPMTEKAMVFEPTPGDEMTAVNVTLNNDAPPPESVEKAQDALANPQPPQLVMPQGVTGTVVLPASAPQPQEPVITDEKRQQRQEAEAQAADRMAEQFVVRTTGENLPTPAGAQPVGPDVPEDAPPVQGEPRTSNEPDQPVTEGEPQPSAQAKGKSKGSK